MTDCTHSRTEMRKQTFANGRCHLRAQCLDCGQLVGPFHPQDGVKLDEVVPVDYQILADYQARQQDQRSRAAGEQRRRRHEEYEVYLRRSPRWARMRQAVLDRDGQLCRGCLAAPATEVHHADGYETIFQEFAWQLVSVCRACHERAHGIATPIGDIVGGAFADIASRRGP